MLTNMNRHKILWATAAFLALISALAGVLYPQMYSKVVIARVLPGTISQDIVALVVSIAALLMLIRLKDEQVTLQIVLLGVLGFYFYAYGIYVIERVYTIFYLVYMAIFGLSFYAMIFAVASIRRKALSQIRLPDGLRKFSVGFSLLMPVVFYPLWISMLIPLMRTGERIEYLYSVFVIDLCFIMPAFVILAVMSAKKQGLGLLLTPALYVVGFAILFPLALGEVLKPLLYDQPLDPFGFWMFLVLSLAFLVVAVIYLRKIQFNQPSEI
jgi:hypothetical protein